MKRCVMCGKQTHGRLTMELVTPRPTAYAAGSEGPDPMVTMPDHREYRTHFGVCDGWCRASFLALPYDRRLLWLLAAEVELPDPRGLIYEGNERFITEIFRAVRAMKQEATK